MNGESDGCNPACCPQFKATSSLDNSVTYSAGDCIPAGATTGVFDAGEGVRLEITRLNSPGACKEDYDNEDPDRDCIEDYPCLPYQLWIKIIAMPDGWYMEWSGSTMLEVCDIEDWSDDDAEPGDVQPTMPAIKRSTTHFPDFTIEFVNLDVACGKYYKNEYTVRAPGGTMKGKIGLYTGCTCCPEWSDEPEPVE